MTAFLTSVLPGFAFGLTLIVAIGAQNAFVLRQGLLQRHVGAVVAICALSDAVLIAAGIAGAGVIVGRVPWVLEAVTWGGAVFLVGYGILAFRRAWRPGTLTAATSGPASLRTAVLTCLALTWLNPHVYLDTVVLLGSVAQQFPNRWLFGVGAAAGSVLWFAALGWGARLLRPLFARPSAWRVLDSLVGATMVALAGALVVNA